MFRSGDFSKIARVTRRTLRHYREIGLFVPDTVDEENGYHYYTVDQLPRLHRILALRDLGFSLEQIGEMMDVESKTADIRTMLTMRKGEIERELLEERRKIRSIESRLKIMEDGAPDYEVVVKSVPEQRFLSTIFHCSGIEHGIMAMSNMQQNLAPLIAEKERGNMVSLLLSENFEPEDADIQMGYIIRGNAAYEPTHVAGLDYEMTTLPAVKQMATVLINDSPDFWHLGTTAIGIWMEHHGYQIAAPCREFWYEFPAGLRETPTVEIQIPVERIGSAR